MPFVIPNTSDALVPGQASPDKVDVDVITGGSGLSGVLTGCAASVTGTNMTVTIAAGTVIIAGRAADVAAGDVTIGAAHATLARYDLVTVNTSGTKAVTAGTAATNPVFPAIPADSVVLHAVYVPAADTAIASNQITDKRLVVVLQTDYLCYFGF